jgi:hypothetical protein
MSRCNGGFAPVNGHRPFQRDIICGVRHRVAWVIETSRNTIAVDAARASEGAGDETKGNTSIPFFYLRRDLADPIEPVYGTYDGSWPDLRL